MALLVLFANVLGLVAFGTFVWLVVLAFKRSTGWGLAVLFLSPIAAIVFAIKFWGEAKRPFLLTTGSTLGICLIMILLVGQMGGFAMFQMMRQAENGEITDEQAAQMIGETLEKWESSGLLDAEEKAALQKMRAAVEQDLGSDAGAGRETSVDSSASPRPAIAPSETSARVAEVPHVTSRTGGERTHERRRYGYVTIPVEEAGSHLGQTVRVVEKSGRRYEGTLAQADGSSLWVERFLSSGTIVLELSEREIDTLSVYFR